MSFKNLKTTFNKIFFIIKLFGFAKFLYLGVLIILAMLLEVFSISLIIPVLGILQNQIFLGNLFSNSEYLKSLNHLEQIYFVVFILCSVFIVKLFFLIFLNYNQYKYTTTLQMQITNKLMLQYLHMPYENFFKRNSSEFMRNLRVESGSFVYGVVTPILILAIEILVVIGISILLFSQIGIASVSMLLIIVVISAIYIKFTKKIINQLGHDRFFYEEKIVKNINEFLYTIRDIKIYFLQNYFISNFWNILDRYASSLKKFLTLQILPRLMIETLLILFIGALLLLLTLQDNSFEQTVITLGLFAATSFRLLPSLNKIISSQQTLRYQVPSVNEIYKELNNNRLKNIPNSKNALNFRKTLELKNINFYYKSKTIILKDLNLKIKFGEKIGIIGYTGSGKSTLIDILVGLLFPTSGQVIIDNTKIDLRKKIWKYNMGYVSQNICLIDDTIKANIAFGNFNDDINNERIKKVLSDVEMWDVVKNLKYKTNTIIGERGITLSGGQKQRLGLARALYHKPPLLILDEAFSALDIETELKIFNRIKKDYKNITIINIAHKGSSLKYCDKVYRLENKKLRIVNKLKK
jgi:ABC-type multidrug transport system fused ATPase/permease subunit